MGRVIQLRSGRWRWRVLDLDEEPRSAGAGPNGGGEQARLLILQDMDVQENRMQVRIPRHLGEPGDDVAVEALARNPESREIIDGDGSVWIVRRAADGEEGAGGLCPQPHRVEASRIGTQGVVERALPENRALGEVTGEELLGLLR